MKTIWIGVIPDIFGYGISVADVSEEKCLKEVKKAYREWAKGTPDTYGVMRNENGKAMTRFEKAMENWGGRIEEINLGEAYYQDWGH